ncbi:choice-of-anchor Q domain-containing protein [Desulfopila sp. IMCC35008]|uniref:choice-of-anchor Q domain-containing protein n=1 Tax=Desulfopila sp. IMCC35008 TaxID=2653858 RepID=UPI0013D5DE94|nr:choice-of-anchor Q domain-containing protein [Desulfopila sp. IMCC35008]
MKFIALVIIVLALVSPVYSATTPVLFFTDLTSGPKIGSTDVSLGQTSGQDGAIVTVWGRGLGNSQGTSKISIGGVNSSYVYYWGNAVAPYSPADMSTRHGMQMIIFQVPSTVADETVNIRVTVDSEASNTLPFTVRSGNIYFVKKTGSDSTGDGSWTSPWQTIIKALDSITAGDIAYIGDGVNQTTLDAYNAAVNLDSSGTATNPKALVTYPGASSTVGATGLNIGFGNWQSGVGKTSHWTIAKFTALADVNASVMHEGFRLVGNKYSAPLGNSPSGAVEGTGNNLYVLGNEFTNCGIAGANKLYHPLYISTPRPSSGPQPPEQSGRDVGWNYFHGNNAIRAIDIYSEGKYGGVMSGHIVHDNYIEDQVGGGILIGGYVVGDNWIYNNIVNKAGLGPDPSYGDPSGHEGVYIAAGKDGYVGNTDIYFYNNTIYGCGYAKAKLSGSTGHVMFGSVSRYTLHFTNNIIYSTGEPYVTVDSDTPTTAAYGNIWYGDGSPPSWDTAALIDDPVFVSATTGDFHLLQNSPARNAGTTIEGLYYDFDGNLRGSSFDLGAYEYMGLDDEEKAEFGPYSISGMEYDRSSSGNE